MKRKGKMERKGQMEMIGLVVIVILITMGMLFMAAFGLRKSPEKSIVTKKGLAVSTMSALTSVTVSEADCIPGGTASELRLGFDILEDCALKKDLAPDGYSNFQCDGKHSCVFFRDTAESLLQETLGQWGKKYEMRFTLLTPAGSQPLFPVVGSGCPRERESSDSLPVQTDAGVVEGILYVC